MPDLGSLMSNPAVRQMASQLAQDPNALSSMLGGLSGAGASGGPASGPK
jgi:hypothetical protein